MIMKKYDVVYCQFPLPTPANDNGEIDYNSLTYQTLDLDGKFEEYTIFRKGRILVNGERLNLTKQINIYTILKGHWIEYQISFEHGKVLRVELISFKGKGF